MTEGRATLALEGFTFCQAGQGARLCLGGWAGGGSVCTKSATTGKTPFPTPGGTCADMCVAASPFHLSPSSLRPHPALPSQQSRPIHRPFPPPCGKGSNFVATQGQRSSRRDFLLLFVQALGLHRQCEHRVGDIRSVPSTILVRLVNSSSKHVIALV